MPSLSGFALHPTSDTGGPSRGPTLESSLSRSAGMWRKLRLPRSSSTPSTAALTPGSCSDPCATYFMSSRWIQRCQSSMVASALTGDRGISLIIAATLDPHREAEASVAPAISRSLRALPVTVARPDSHAIVCTVEFCGDEAPIEPDAIEAFLRAPSELIGESPFSAGARRVYRRGDTVLKIQRHDVSDPKPTLLEDEFHLLRRLQGRSARFPVTTGYGIEASFSWIGYGYVDGEPLGAWLSANPEEARGRLFSFGVDLDEMLNQLADCQVAHRDLNPGNLIHRPDGSLVLIDFDQATSGAEYASADLSGVDQGAAKNDLDELLDRVCLTRVANELLSALDDAWFDDVPFSLGVLGCRFGGGWQLDPLLEAARDRLQPLANQRVLDLCSRAPVVGLLLASAGAEVTAVVDDSARWERLARLIGPRFQMVSKVADAAGPFDLTSAIGAATSAPEAGVVLRENMGRPGERAASDRWFTTTHLTEVAT